MEKYRFESGSAYEYDAQAKAYLFIGKLNGRTKKQFIEEMELQSAFSAHDEVEDY